MGQLESAVAARPSVLGRFVVALGPGSREWVRSLEGFEVVDTGNEQIHAAVDGAVHVGRAEDGSRWIAVADLVEGSLEDGARAVDAELVPQRAFRGRFAEVAWRASDARVAAVTDHFGTLPLYVLERGEVFVVTTDLRLLTRSPWSRRELDLASVYHYLNFSVIPAPHTIFRDVARLLPATRLVHAGTTSSTDRYFVPEYPDDLRGSDDDFAAQLTERIVHTVAEYEPPGSGGWGCFLSGGTDSSSIASILSRHASRTRVKSFSIGFAEADFDELEYAHLAAEACGADATYGKVSREEAQTLAMRVIDDYDQPFGNASAVPTLACAELARHEGIELLVAGDGGDEIFGGNERYAKDRVMEAWFSAPAPLKAVGRAAGSIAGKSSSHFLNRVDNFFRRASLPNPDRFFSDEAFAADRYDELLSPEFRAEVPREASLEVMRETYELGSTGGPLHRIMRLDLLMAIAQNDVPKVHGAARLAGVSVRFPYLDPALVSFTNRLSERQKVRGLTKRYCFKRAMKDILPEATLKKKKHGFGLPIADWLRTDDAFRDGVSDALLGERARARGLFQPAAVEALLAEHLEGRWDRADCLWRLFVLELWLRRHADAA